MRLCLVLFFVLTVSSFAAEGFKTENIVLYQPDEILRERVSSADAIAAYFKEVETLMESEFRQHITPANLDMVIAMKPEGRVRCWFICGDEKLSKQLVELRN